MRRHGALRQPSARIRVRRDVFLESDGYAYAVGYGNPAGGGPETAEIHRSRNFGATWTYENDLCSNGSPGRPITVGVGAAPGGVLAERTSAGVSVSHNGGVTWQATYSCPSVNTGDQGIEFVGLRESECRPSHLWQRHCAQHRRRPELGDLPVPELTDELVPATQSVRNLEVTVIIGWLVPPLQNQARVPRSELTVRGAASSGEGVADC